ncbi:MAG TPA: tripartite tricarboxylate transporter substrate-binding protein, partial [Casimicrobiaceae bacterium]
MAGGTIVKRIALATGLAVFAFCVASFAQTWPTKPIKWIVPFAPGGTTDILARTIGEKLTVALGQPVIVENKPGAGGGVGADFTAKSPPDGYTIMGGTISTHAINASLYKTLPYDPIKDFVPITMIARVPNMLVVNPEIPAKNVAELIALLKANPGKYSFASSGNGTSQHLSGELFKSMAGVDMQHIPYKGSPPALQDVVAGQVAMTFDNITTAWPLAKGGKLRALAVTTAKRSAIAP